MTRLIATLAALAAGIFVVAGPAGATAGHATARTITVGMHDPGCHWFSVAGAYKKTMSVKGPVALLNLDEAALKIAGPKGVTLDKVGKKVVLASGLYRITMVGQAPDDNTLKLTVR